MLREYHKPDLNLVLELLILEHSFLRIGVKFNEELFSNFDIFFDLLHNDIGGF